MRVEGSPRQKVEEKFTQKPTDPDDYELREEYDLSKLPLTRKGRYAVAAKDSPLNVEGVDLGLTVEEILQDIQKGRGMPSPSEDLVVDEDRVRAITAEHGLDWDTMTEQDRERFIDELLHSK